MYIPSITNVKIVFLSFFYTGASLAIYFDKNDFVGDIRPLANYILVDLDNGLTIEGIGNVKWKFHTKNAVIVVTSSCYYVLQARARLVSPQRLSSENGGHWKIFSGRTAFHIGI